jgi:hypothetical protein
MSFLDRIFGVPGAQPSPPPGLLPARPGAPGLRGLRGGLGVLGDDPTPVLIEGIPVPIKRPTLDEGSVYRVAIPTGADGTLATLQAMKDMAIQGSQQPVVITDARAVVRDCGPKDYACEYAAIQAWVKDVLTYRHDSTFQEMQQSGPFALYVSGDGDCNNASCVVAMLDLAIGAIGVKYRAVFLDAGNPGEASHVYAMVLVPDDSGNLSWQAQDTVPDPAVFGFEPPSSLWQQPPIDLVVVAPAGY